MFTLYTNVGASLDGAEIKTFFAPPSLTCAEAAVVDRNFPVHSATYSAPRDCQSILSMRRSEIKAISCPLIDRLPFSKLWISSGPWIILDSGPCVESCVNRRMKSSMEAQVWFMATISISSRSRDARRTLRPAFVSHSEQLIDGHLPILPKPLIPTRHSLLERSGMILEINEEVELVHMCFELQSIAAMSTDLPSSMRELRLFICQLPTSSRDVSEDTVHITDLRSTGRTSLWHCSRTQHGCIR